MQYAEVLDGLVARVIVADQSFIDQQPGQWIACTEARKNTPGPGWVYDESRDVFTTTQPEDIEGYGEYTFNDETALWEPPVGYIDPLTLARDKAILWERIKAERDRRKLDGGYKVGSKWFHSDTFSRTQQIGLVLLGSSIPSGLQWKTMDGSFVTMTQTLANQIFGAAAAQDVATFQAAEVHKAAMEASADPSAYDFSGGWPAIYGV